MKPSKYALFRFYAELNDFLPPERRHCALEHVFDLAASVKDMIEALGVPHTEVDLILINGLSAGFAAIVSDGDRISVFPRFHSLDIFGLSLVRPEPVAEARFVLDVHLGRLATYLRMAGFDTLYDNGYADEELARISAREPRILLTADRGLLKRAIVRYGYYVRSREPREQLVEVLRYYELFNRVRPFERCLECNTPLLPATREQVLERLPPKTRELHTEFFACCGCERVYWKGSHYEHMKRFLEAVIRQSAPEVSGG